MTTQQLSQIEGVVAAYKDLLDNQEMLNGSPTVNMTINAWTVTTSAEDHQKIVDILKDSMTQQIKACQDSLTLLTAGPSPYQ
jgi:hypothetical protein